VQVAVILVHGALHPGGGLAGGDDLEASGIAHVGQGAAGPATSEQTVSGRRLKIVVLVADEQFVVRRRPG
jgi:hypothetical protein